MKRHKLFMMITMVVFPLLLTSCGLFDDVESDPVTPPTPEEPELTIGLDSNTIQSQADAE